LERAGFEHQLVCELDEAPCHTLKENRPQWSVSQCDVRELNGRSFRGIDLFAGGVPCPPFSIAGRQLGADDERDLFPTALRLIEESKPVGVMLENVPGLASARFGDYRKRVIAKLTKLGYQVDWQVLNSASYGVPQLRPRFILVALKGKAANYFVWPAPVQSPPSVGDTVSDLMAARRWPGASAWAERARGIGPTLVGGSKKHGGPDLGPTRARQRWLELGVDGIGIADSPPGQDAPYDHVPKLTVRMGARIQGFPDSWAFVGRKTAAWRQVGNAFPPPVAAAVGTAIMGAIHMKAPATGAPQLNFKLRQA
jgi:DNA (cytosine-5)-methyltransferase 1